MLASVEQPCRDPCVAQLGQFNRQAALPQQGCTSALVFMSSHLPVVLLVMPGQRSALQLAAHNSAMQQARVMREQTGLSVSHFVGSMGVDLWGKASWRNNVEPHSVLVMTYQIMVNVLSCGFLQVHQPLLPVL